MRCRRQARQQRRELGSEPGNLRRRDLYRLPQLCPCLCRHWLKAHRGGRWESHWDPARARVRAWARRGHGLGAGAGAALESAAAELSEK